MKNRFSFKGFLLAVLKCLGYFAIYFIGQIVAGMVAGYIFKLANPNISEDTLNNLINSSIVELSILANAITVLIFAFFFKWRASSLTEGAYINKMPFRYITTLMVLGLCSLYAVSLALSVIPFPESWLKLLESTNSPLTDSSPTVLFIMVVILAPLLEEILFRGLFIGTLKKAVHPWVAIIISAIVFGFAHGSPFDMVNGNPIGFIYSSCMGILLGWIFVKFDSITPTLIFHATYNFASAFLGVNTFLLLVSVPIMVYEIRVISKFRRGE